MKSLYAMYIKERESQEIVESDKGFATYKIFDNGECYLRDLYVKPDFRKTGLATEMADEICSIAKKNGCTHLIGSVCVDDKNATTNLKVLLSYEMQVCKVVGNMIFLQKDIE